MSSSSNRSSSAVRDLRNIFENKSNDNSVYDPRGRSPSGLNGSDKENGRPQSKIRASFVPVDLVPTMADKTEPSQAPKASEEPGKTEPTQAEGLPESKGSIDERRSSFTEGAEGGPQTDMKNAVTEEHEKREKDKSIAEPVPEAAVESAQPTPAVQQASKNPMDEAPVLDAELPSANPDKPVTGVEEEPGAMKPADPTNAEAVSGGDGLPPTTEDLRDSGTAAPSAASKSVTKPVPTSLSTKSQPKAGTAKSSAPPSTISPSSRTSQQTSTPKAPRASLTAPTASSVAKNAPTEKTNNSAPAKSKPREPTRPVELPSRLTAPTAASKAKHEQESSTSATSSRQSLGGRSQPQAKATPRSSLAGGHRPETNGNARKLAPAPDASFLERMMRPTAASQSKVHEKVEPKAPSPKSKPVARRPKPAAPKPVDGTQSTPAAEKGDSQPEAEPVRDSTPADDQAEAGASTADATDSTVPAGTVLEKVDALESTPASLGDEIR